MYTQEHRRKVLNEDKRYKTEVLGKYKADNAISDRAIR